MNAIRNLWLTTLLAGVAVSSLGGCNYLDDAAKVSSQGQAVGARMSSYFAKGIAARKGRCADDRLEASLQDSARAKHNHAPPLDSAAFKAAADKAASQYKVCLDGSDGRGGERAQIEVLQDSVKVADAFTKAFTSMGKLAGEDIGKAAADVAEDVETAASLLQSSRVIKEKLTDDDKKKIGSIAAGVSDAIRAKDVKAFAKSAAPLAEYFSDYIAYAKVPVASVIEDRAAKRAAIRAQLSEAGMLDDATPMQDYLTAAGIKTVPSKLNDQYLLVFQRGVLFDDAAVAKKAADDEAEAIRQDLASLKARLDNLAGGVVRHKHQDDAVSAGAAKGDAGKASSADAAVAGKQ